MGNSTNWINCCLFHSARLVKANAIRRKWIIPLELIALSTAFFLQWRQTNEDLIFFLLHCLPENELETGWNWEAVYRNLNEVNMKTPQSFFGATQKYWKIAFSDLGACISLPYCWQKWKRFIAILGKLLHSNLSTMDYSFAKISTKISNLERFTLQHIIIIEYKIMHVTLRVDDRFVDFFPIEFHFARTLTKSTTAHNSHTRHSASQSVSQLLHYVFHASNSKISIQNNNKKGERRDWYSRKTWIEMNK